MNWVAFLTYTAVTAATPGPNNIMSMSNGSRLGFKRALPFNWGVLIGFSSVALLCTLFVSLLSALVPKIKLPMLAVGAAYMLHLAWKLFRSSGAVEETRSHSGFFPGIFLQFINPKAYLAIIVAMEAYIIPFYGDRPMHLAGFALFIAFTGFTSTLCWSAFGSVFKWLFATHARAVNAVMALLLVYCAVSLFI